MLAWVSSSSEEAFLGFPPLLSSGNQVPREAPKKAFISPFLPDKKRKVFVPLRERMGLKFGPYKGQGVGHVNVIVAKKNSHASLVSSRELEWNALSSYSVSPCTVQSSRDLLPVRFRVADVRQKGLMGVTQRRKRVGLYT